MKFLFQPKIFLLSACVFNFAPAQAQNANVDANPFVNLYKQRVNVSIAETAKQHSVSENARVKWEKLKFLAANGAVPQMEADNQSSVYQVALKTEYILSAKVARTKALYQVARLRVGAGLAMPICTDPEIPGATELPVPLTLDSSESASSEVNFSLSNIDTVEAETEELVAWTLESSPSPYLTIYAKGLEITKIAVERQRIVLANEERNLARYAYLLSRKVIAQQIYDAQKTRVDVSRVSVADLKAKVAQQQALYNIVKLKVDNGLEIAVCPEGD